MKYLSLFILTTYVLFVLIASSEKPKINKNSKVKNFKVGKSKAKGPTLPTTQKPATLTEGDLMVCQAGRNLGLLDMGNSCRQKFSGFCNKMIKREKTAPVLSKIAKSKKAKKELLKSKKSAAKRKPKKKWSLRARFFKFHPEEAKRYEAERKRRAQRKLLQKKKKQETRKVVNQIINRGLYAKAVSKKQLKKQAKKLVNRVKEGRMKELRKSLNLPPKRITKVQKKPLPENGEYCVHAVQWNLNHCCYFKKKSLAQKFANTQPIQTEFRKQLKNGWIAHIRDRERQAKKVIEKTNKALQLLNKNKKKIARKNKTVKGKVEKKNKKKIKKNKKQKNY